MQPPWPQAFYTLSVATGQPVTAAEKERLFHEVFGPDGDDPGLAWRVKGRSNPQKPPAKWQQYQLLVDSAEDERLLSGYESRKLYRDLLRSLRGVAPSIAADVCESARAQYADHASLTDVGRLRALIVDGRHSLEQLEECLKTAAGQSENGRMDGT